ncbi:MAG: CAP domain-containing protein [Bradymonadaceae bacterium]
MDGYPNLSERVVLYLTNRARSEPDAFNPDIPYPPTHPLRFDTNLSKAARWQAQHIIDDGCWCADHSSCCEIGSDGSDVFCIGASTTCGVTSVGDRVRFWSNQYSGENAAQGYPTPAAALDGWISSPGHWENINSGHHTLLGPGQFARGWVQVFGTGSPGIPVAEDGVHFANGSSFTFASTYYQKNTGGPRAALVIIGGECHDLQLVNGEPEYGAFERSVPLAAGCHRYYFHFTDGRGDDHTYPSTGSFAVAIGQAEGQCPFYLDTRPADTCSPSGQPCSTGETRRCYTGPWGTEGVGQCKAGSERCIGGQWTGECREQITPDAEETCDDEIDNTCNGIVDEGCPGHEPDVDVWEGDVIDGPDAGGATGGRGQSGGRCTMAPGDGLPIPTPATVLALWLAPLALVCYLGRRRRRI